MTPSSTNFVYVDHAFYDIKNPVLMFGHNIGPDGKPADPSRAMIAVQVEDNFPVREPDGTLTILCEVNEDIHMPTGQKWRWRCTKIKKSAPHEYVDQRFHFAGHGRLSFATLSNIDKAGRVKQAFDSGGNILAGGGVFFLVTDAEDREKHVPLGELKCDGYDKVDKAVVEIGNRGNPTHFNSPTSFKKPVTFADGFSGDKHVGNEIWTFEGGRLVRIRSRNPNA